MNIKYIIIGILFFTGALSFGMMNTPVNNVFLTSPSGNDFLNYDKPISDLITEPKINKKNISIMVEKSKLKLTVFYDKQPIKSFPVVLGFNPVDDKLKEGDGCTPEGTFKVKAFYKHSKWSKFIWLNYPTIDSWKKYSDAKKSKKIKLSDTIGGQIGIHGVPENSDYLVENKVNWTLGCVSLKNKDIEEIFGLVKNDTIVQILK